ncbi:MAG: FAD binding domain-containing protein [Desulfarculus sp.]|nr:FAD binding domain-containing protein [Desulfarculus sp.]
MSLPHFQYLAPLSLAEALEQKALWGGQAAWLSGGSDLLTRAKQGLVSPEALISLKHLSPELAGLSEEANHLRLGAQTTLHQALSLPLIARELPGLAEACAAIGAPTLQQRVATVGGNLCAQTRCLHYNQSALWRAGLAPCFKLGGEVCHPGGAGADRCRSTCQSDGAVMLMALGASVVLQSATGQRTLTLSDFFTGQGERPQDIGPDEMLTHVILERPGPGLGSAYVKMASRGAVDFPLLSAGAAMRIEGGLIASARLALGAVFAAPLLLKTAMEPLLGQAPTPENLAQAAAQAGRDAAPFMIENHSTPAAWRAQMVPVVVARALERAASRAQGGI